MNKKRIIIIIAVVLLVVICILMLPKEEELYTKPVIEAYQNDDLEFEEVRQGDLIKEANLSLSVMNIGEEKLAFQYNDFPIKGIYVKEGDYVSEGDILAELSSTGREEFVSDSSTLILKAPCDGIVTYVMDIAEGEKSVSSQYIIMINKLDKYIINTFTPYWNLFKEGDVYSATINGIEKNITVIDPSDVGIEKLADPDTEGASSRVYFAIQEEGLLLYSGMTGTLTITLDQRENVLYIPAGAVNIVNGEEIVYVENADGIRSIHTIKTGLNTGHLVEVIDGLSLGDKVIVD